MWNRFKNIFRKKKSKIVFLVNEDVDDSMDKILQDLRKIIQRQDEEALGITGGGMITSNSTTSTGATIYQNTTSTGGTGKWI